MSYHGYNFLVLPTIKDNAGFGTPKMSNATTSLDAIEDTFPNDTAIAAFTVFRMDDAIHFKQDSSWVRVE